MALDLTSFAAALKQHYLPERVENLVYMDNPLFAMMPKYESFGGDVLKLPIHYGNPQGRSATFSNAQANKTSSKLKAFLLTRNKDYSLASIDNETIEASKGNANAFMEAATTEIDGAIHSITRSLAISMYGTGSGSIGKIGAIGGAGNVEITLANAEDVTNFEVGMKLQFDAVDGGGVPNATTLDVVGVDRDNGIVTVNGDAAVASAVSEFIFIDGDYDLKIKGIRAWIPDVAPVAGDNFFGVDRSVDVTRLSGIRYDGSALPIEEALIDAASRVAREGGKPDYCFLSYQKFANLEKALGSKVQYVDHKVGEIGFRGILIHGPRGPIRVIADQNCPSDRAFMLSMQYWKLNSLGKCPKILDSDGLKMLRESNADAVEVRVGYYAQLSCKNPSANANIFLG